jgi:hypothetical protein
MLVKYCHIFLNWGYMNPHGEIPFICGETPGERASGNHDSFLLYKLFSARSQVEHWEHVGDLV